MVWSRQQSAEHAVHSTDLMMRQVFLTTLMAMLLWGLGVGPLRAGNPLQTNDPGTPGRNGFEVNLFNSIRLTRNEFTQSLPVLNINYGRVDNDQWKISIPVIQVDPEPGASHWGVGDIQLGWKYRFLEEEDYGFMASIYPQPLLPTGNHDIGLGNGNWEAFLPVSVAKHFLDERLFVYGEAAYNVVFDDPRQDTAFFGLAAELEITKKTILVAEIADIVTIRSDRPDEPFFNLGFTHHFNDRIALQTAFGRSLGDESRGASFFNSYVGLQITWGGNADKDKDKGDTRDSRISSLFSRLNRR